MLSIRQTEMNDLSTIEWLYNAALKESFGEVALHKSEQGASRWHWYLGTQSEFRFVLIAERSTSPSILQSLGYAYLAYDDPTLSLMHLYVVNSFRGQGIGKRLLREAQKKCIDFGNDKFRAESIKGNSLGDFYEHMGGSIIESQTRQLTFVDKPVMTCKYEWSVGDL